MSQRRSSYHDVGKLVKNGQLLGPSTFSDLEFLFKLYRSLCAILYNFVPTSGHPGGSISSGVIRNYLLYHGLYFDISNPNREDADVWVEAAGHKALGLYTALALMDEVVRIGASHLLPEDMKDRLRLEDLLGFRRNPETDLPLFKQYRARALDGHSTPATPFVRIATGASGVGLATAVGLALGRIDYYGKEKAPKVHILEGEGGLTPGRVSEAMAAASAMGLSNIVLHVDWNQSSIDSDRVCAEDDQFGDYVQWTPMELGQLHDWNVIYVPDGMSFTQVNAAFAILGDRENGQPTMIVYRTEKGYKYGITGKKSHGAGHKLCTSGFYEATEELRELGVISLPNCFGENLCQSGSDQERIEVCYAQALLSIRSAMEISNYEIIKRLSNDLVIAQTCLNEDGREKKIFAPEIGNVYGAIDLLEGDTPESLILTPGNDVTLRGVLGDALNFLNRGSYGAILCAAADLLDSVSVGNIGNGFPDGFFHAERNPDSRKLSTGGICEDAMSAILAGLSANGHHIGVGGSYAAFMAPLGHIAARLHAIGQQAKKVVTGQSYNPFILVCGHAGLETGEDGPTHADVQALQLLQENFPGDTMITLTPWEPQEIWPLLAKALSLWPAIIAIFVTRPPKKVLDRKALGLSGFEESINGVYLLRKATNNKPDVNIILQESGVTYAFVVDTLPRLLADGIDPNVYYVASAELFARLDLEVQEQIFPERVASFAMGVTGFTKPTMDRWIMSISGRLVTLHPFKKGHYLGSGQAAMVLKEAGLDGESQYRAIKEYARYVDLVRGLNALCESV